jgi:glutamate--cysteine ligase catalytic subunit
MGCCCLQMTFQAQSIEEARHLYDQLTPLTPIFLALSAASPIWRGYLSDVDCRWNVISASCDDRTLEELGKEPLKNDRFVINKSRYASIDCYLSEQNQKYNDIPLIKDQQLYQELASNGIDDTMSNHISHLFIRDPLVLFREKLDIDDEVETDHFENIQSTNWQTMRFKPPPINSPIGWRVEFRPTELQITDFENAAFVTFLVLMTRAILSFKLDMLIPISKVDENLQRAQKRDACLREKFYFRKNIYDSTQESEIIEMSVNEVVNGSDRFPGCIQLIKDYLSNLDVDVDTQCTIKQYLSFIEARASGRLMTTAAWMRKFVTTHPKYKEDSRVSEEINYDLMWRIYLISTGQIKCPELLPSYQTKSVE